jgi:AraC-like DNA-binding protein
MKEKTRFSAIQISGRIEVLHARYYEHVFSPHWHQEYAIGLIDAGVEQFQYHGVTHRAGEGEIVLLNAGEVHTGEGLDERGFGFRMLYIPESTFRDIASPEVALPESFRFRSPILHNSTLRRKLLTAHLSLEAPVSPLQQESQFVEAIAGVMSEASTWAPPGTATKAPFAMLAARELLHDHLFEDVRLTHLAQIAGISKFHFLRAFRNQFGLPPHAYQLQHRVFRAKELLRDLPPAEVAQQCGFSDQSHFHRVFRALVGSTPGQYAGQFRTPMAVLPDAKGSVSDSRGK